MFFSGATYFVLRQYIRLSMIVLAPLLILLVGACFLSKTAFFAIYVFGISYITFYVAYAPRGFVRRFNGVSDFSYGIYIYAFPIQQTVVAIAPGISALSLFMWSGLATFAFAMLSWFVVEKPAQHLKPRLVAELMRRLGYERNGATWRRLSVNARCN
jgi:peptidoglycan/LPS O-acetylase OafA/YrhL